jgi:hypothetical protein
MVFDIRDQSIEISSIFDLLENSKCEEWVL